MEVARIHQLPDGIPVAIRVHGMRLLLLRRGGDVTTTDEQCPHEGASLVAGEIDGDVVVCAMHHWRFDMRSGRCLTGATDLTVYPTRVEGDRVLVALRRKPLD